MAHYVDTHPDFTDGSHRAQQRHPLLMLARAALFTAWGALVLYALLTI